MCSSPMAQFAWSAMTATTIANQRVFTFKILAAIIAIAEEESIFKKPITTITIIIVDIIIFSFNSIL